MATPSPTRAKGKRWSLVVAVILIVPTAFLIPSVDRHLRGTAILTRLTDPAERGGITLYRQHPVTVSDWHIATSQGDIPANRYAPADLADPPVLVLLHGVQYLGIEEPRMIAFARAIAASGLEVVTPLLPKIARFEVSTDSIEIIGQTAKLLHERHGHPVCVVGMSFSGGLALVAAADRRYAGHIGCVVAVGAHDDMERVSRFFATGEAPRPDGSVLHRAPHEYGSLVLIASAPEDFFAPADVPAAKQVLDTLLRTERIDAARPEARTLSPAGMAIMERIFNRDREPFREQLLASITRRRETMRAVSPHDRLAQIHVPVILIHGSGDDIIPPTETEWLAEGLPPRYREEVLVTPLLSHVTVEKQVTSLDRIRVVHAMAEILDAAER